MNIKDNAETSTVELPNLENPAPLLNIRFVRSGELGVPVTVQGLSQADTDAGGDDKQPAETRQVRDSNSPYVTTEEAAAYLRKSVSWMLRQKDIPYQRGTPNIYDKRDLDEWFMGNKYLPQVG